MVLHTWNQKLDAHWHIHALVPGGGPSQLDGSWKAAVAPCIDESSLELQSRKYLVDAINLRNDFRKFAITRLKRLRREGKLQFGGSLEYLRDEEAWDELLAQLGGVDWVSYIEPPRRDVSRAEHLVRYLTRYMTGGPISDSRIIEANEDIVTFLAREGETTGGDDIQVPYTLPTREFVRRWCLHIQPQQLTKVRYFGGWSTREQQQYQERSAIGLDALEESRNGDSQLDTDFDPFFFEPSAETSTTEPLVCEHCGSQSLRLVYERDKASWRDLLKRGAASCPPWYSKTLEQDDRAWWDAKMGEGFSEWYDEHLKTELESARELHREQHHRPGPHEAYQPFLPGLEPTSTWISDSF
jgi:hypothetical protein